MAQHGTITIPAGTWTEITDADVNVRGKGVRLLSGAIDA